MGPKKLFDLKTNFLKILGLKNKVRFEKILGPKKFEFKIFSGSNRFSGLKLWALIKFWVWKKFFPRTFWSTKIMTQHKFGPKSFVKIGPVTAEILLIWTNLIRAYVAWTNVAITVGIF